MKFKHHFTMRRVGLLVLLAAFLVLLTAASVKKRDYSPLDRAFYLTDKQIAFVRPGLQFDITDVMIAGDGTVSVDFTVADDRGLPLDLDGVFTPGPISASFVLTRIPEGETQHVAYTVRNQTSPITNVTAEQAAADSGGSFTKLGEGNYRYTFGTKLPAGFNPNETHAVGVWATRDLSEFELERQVANTVVNFLPSGGPVQVVRDVAATESCNRCHDPLGAHGGARQLVELCVLCHTPQTTDPDTGNTVNFPVLVHKIHRGEDLPSSQAGTPFQIIGFRQSLFDVSEIVFPQDVRYCQTCHNPELASQAEAYLLRPNRAACGACHDDVNFATGENHLGGPVLSDRFCSNCHFPEGELEFDSSIRGAHIIPNQSAQLEGINIEIREVVNTGPGQMPTVFFSLKTDAGATISPSSMPLFNLVLAGPTTDYSFLRSESAAADSVPFEDGFTYTFQNPIPEDAEGTFVVGAEARRTSVLNAGFVNEFTTNESAQENPVYFFGVTDPEPEPRRMVVTDANCETCHENLELHGTIRHDPQYCVLCHQPGNDDSNRRPEDQLPAQSIDFKFMVHRIHRGEELTRDFTVFGFGSRPINFNEVLYPGDLRNCAKCHVGESYFVNSPGILPTAATEREFFTPIPPNSAACLACHDSLEAAAHAFVQIAPFGEACGACHGAQADASVARVHAR